MEGGGPPPSITDSRSPDKTLKRSRHDLQHEDLNNSDLLIIITALRDVFLSRSLAEDLFNIIATSAAFKLFYERRSGQSVENLRAALARSGLHAGPVVANAPAPAEFHARSPSLSPFAPGALPLGAPASSPAAGEAYPGTIMHGHKQGSVPGSVTEAPGVADVHPALQTPAVPSSQGPTFGGPAVKLQMSKESKVEVHNRMTEIRAMGMAAEQGLPAASALLAASDAVLNTPAAVNATAVHPQAEARVETIIVSSDSD